MPFFVYILLNPEGKTYVGQTPIWNGARPGTMIPTAG